MISECIAIAASSAAGKGKPLFTDTAVHRCRIG